MANLQPLRFCNLTCVARIPWKIIDLHRDVCDNIAETRGPDFIDIGGRGNVVTILQFFVIYSNAVGKWGNP